MQMRFSMKTEYGVRALLELAANRPRGALQSAEIARRRRIPGPFLDQVLMILRRGGLVQSVRGPHGGHLLARAPAEIRLDEVIACLEGAGGERSSTDRPGGPGESSVLSTVSREAERAARRVFASHTVEDLMRVQQAEPPVFHGIFRQVTARTRRRG
jgi:Rrf2 family protein